MLAVVLGVPWRSPQSMSIGGDATTVGFGPARVGALREQLKDVNRDGVLDRVFVFPGGDAGLSAGDVEACVTGNTRVGEPFAGCDDIETF